MSGWGERIERKKIDERGERKVIGYIYIYINIQSPYPLYRGIHSFICSVNPW